MTQTNHEFLEKEGRLGQEGCRCKPTLCHSLLSKQLLQPLTSSNRTTKDTHTQNWEVWDTLSIIIPSVGQGNGQTGWTWEWIPEALQWLYSCQPQETCQSKNLYWQEPHISILFHWLRSREHYFSLLLVISAYYYNHLSFPQLSTLYSLVHASEWIRDVIYYFLHIF